MTTTVLILLGKILLCVLNVIFSCFLLCGVKSPSDYNISNLEKISAMVLGFFIIGLCIVSHIYIAFMM